jgi:hypothetical protein
MCRAPEEKVLHNLSCDGLKPYMSFVFVYSSSSLITAILELFEIAVDFQEPVPLSHIYVKNNGRSLIATNQNIRTRS